ncbi:helix-turn-helix domain-containing protein [Streptomyces sp. NPDC057699]|uniref:helix-turn-helix domain-containing protein n=1 Tax=Streptomyces sp. NPDC057699 TaxID=3346220 RepID=UPI00369B8F6E
MLEILGLGSAEEAVYSALLARPTASAQELARQTGMEQDEITRILHDLAARDLVALASEADGEAPESAGSEGSCRPDRYRLTPPSVAVAPLLVEQRKTLHRAEAAYSMLTEQHRGTCRRQRRGGGPSLVSRAGSERCIGAYAG